MSEGASRPRSGAAQFWIRIKGLRRRETSTPDDGLTRFEIAPDTADGQSRSNADAGIAKEQQALVSRAIVAAEEAGLKSYRVELAPDGTITIVVGEPSEPGGDAVDG